ncbi:MAG: NEW3 domain-containing protein [Chloroflexota bacterium]
MRHLRFLLFVILLATLALGLPSTVLAQDGSPSGPLWINTDYPSIVVGADETVTLNLRIGSTLAHTVDLAVTGLPKGWTAEFRGAGRVIQSVYLAPDVSPDIDLRLIPSEGVTPGTYEFTVVARGSGLTAEFPIELNVKDKLPAQLTFETEFPTIRSGSDATFSFSTTLKNDGDEDITVVLTADAPREFAVTFRASGRDITNLPTDIAAGSSQTITISAEPLTTLAVGSYPINVKAEGDNLDAALSLTAEVVGQPQLSITAPDGRLSGEAVLGSSTPIKLILKNSGNSPAVGVTLSATAPAGWTVTLDPEQILEVPAEGEVEVTANIEPAEKAIAGDYVITFRAQPNEGASKSAEFRVTVQTSTLWGFAGVALIAVAVAVVGLAVVRFGRR